MDGLKVEPLADGDLAGQKAAQSKRARTVHLVQGVVADNDLRLEAMLRNLQSGMRGGAAR
jgi:hypothetical protein